MTLARFYVLSASANFIFSATMTVFAVTKGYSNLAVTFGVMVILSIAEWCWAYGKYLLIDVYGNNGSATIECNPSGGSEKYYNPDGSPIWSENRGFESNPSTITLEPGTRWIDLDMIVELLYLQREHRILIGHYQLEQMQNHIQFLKLYYQLRYKREKLLLGLEKLGEEYSMSLVLR